MMKTKTSNENNDNTNANEMITPGGKNDGGAAALAPPRNKGPKLDIDQKRQLAIEWFADPNVSNIGKFCVEIKQVPQARPFLRKCATELGLFDLRKLRKDNEGIDEIAAARILSFRPKWNNKVGGDRAATSGALDADAMKKLLVEFFDDEKMTPLPRYLRNNNALVHKDAVLRLIRKVHLRKMRQDRDAVIRLEVLSKIDEAIADGQKKEDTPPLESCETGLKHLQIGAGARGVGRKKALEAIAADQDKLKPLLMEWFDDAEMPSIVDFLKKKDAFEMKKTMRILVRTGGLQKLRKNRENSGVREEGLKTIDGLFTNGEKVTKRRRLEQKAGSGLSQSNQNNNADAEVMKDILQSWFDDADMISIRDLLKQRGESQMNSTMVSLLGSNGLRRLRKKREAEGVREEAMKKIDEALMNAPEASKIKKDRIIVGKPAQQLAAVDKDYMTALVSEWFEDEDARPVPKFLRHREESHLSASMLRLVRKNGLCKLRKSRDDPEARELANTRIANLFADGKDGKKEGNLRRGQGRPGVQMRGQMINKSEEETIKGYLVEWVYDDDLISIVDYLEEKGRPELKPVMAMLIKKQGLRKLRKERHILRQTVTRKIDNAFKKNGNPGGRAKATKIAPSAPPMEEMEPMDNDEAEYVAVDGATQEDAGEDNFVVIH